MATLQEWIWNEIKQVGKDYASIEEVSYYDESHAKFRDVIAESTDILDSFTVINKVRLLDIGCGTGVFARVAAEKGFDVTAADVSETMLTYAKKQTPSDKINSINYVHGGFLTLNNNPQSFDFITTSFSFHHLPDFYKWLALKRIHDWLDENGLLFIQDVVIEENSCIDNINSLIDHQENLGGDFLKNDAIQHFQEEYSTFDWILDEMLRRTGFTIENKKIADGLLGQYWCRKI